MPAWRVLAVAALVSSASAGPQGPGPRAVHVGEGPLLFATLLEGGSDRSFGAPLLHVLDPEGELPPQLVWQGESDRGVPRPLARVDRSRVIIDHDGRGWVLDLDAGLATPFLEAVSSELVDVRAGTITFVAPRLRDPKTALAMPSRLFVLPADGSAEPELLADLGVAAVLCVADGGILVLAADRRICLVGRSGRVDPIGSFPTGWDVTETTSSISPSGRYAALVAKGEDLDRRGKRAVAVLDLVASRALWSREQDWDRFVVMCGFCGPFREPPAKIEWHGVREDLILEPFGASEMFGLEAATGKELTATRLLEILRDQMEVDLGRRSRLDDVWLFRYGSRATAPEKDWVAWTGLPEGTLHVADADFEERPPVAGTWALNLCWLPAVP